MPSLTKRTFSAVIWSLVSAFLLLLFALDTASLPSRFHCWRQLSGLLRTIGHFLQHKQEREFTARKGIHKKKEGRQIARTPAGLESRGCDVAAADMHPATGQSLAAIPQSIRVPSALCNGSGCEARRVQSRGVQPKRLWKKRLKLPEVAYPSCSAIACIGKHATLQQRHTHLGAHIVDQIRKSTGQFSLKTALQCALVTVESRRQLRQVTITGRQVAS
jgi:hypothetical protein